jgi:two-component sensor histidine kinase
MADVLNDVGLSAPVWRLPLGGKPERIDVRRWIRGKLSTELDTHTLVDVLLVVGELVGNAYQHTSSPRELRVVRSEAGVLVEVADGDVRHPSEMATSDNQWGGRGIQVLIELATSWGVRLEGGGKVVWALLPLLEPRFKPRQRSGS